MIIAHIIILLLLNAQSVPTVIIRVKQISSDHKTNSDRLVTNTITFEKKFGENESVNGRTEIRKAKSLAAGETPTAIF